MIVLGTEKSETPEPHEDIEERPQPQPPNPDAIIAHAKQLEAQQQQQRIIAFERALHALQTEHRIIAVPRVIIRGGQIRADFDYEVLPLGAK